jgi:5'-methylthioadenosine phosphorylase
MPRRRRAPDVARVGILGGTGFSALAESTDAIPVETPWGDVTVGHRREGDLDLFLVRRHGEPPVAPHRIVHRANVEALVRCKVDAVFALNAVGALDPTVPAGSLLVPDDLLDLRRRTETFHDERPVHVDLGEPYCPHLRARLLDAARAKGRPAREGGVYACTEGPRLETPAEVRMLRLLGGTVVGMTGCPEAALARERALCYASLCLVTNPAAGLSPEPLSAHRLRMGAETLAPTALQIVLEAARHVDAGVRPCRCRHALDDAKL